MSDLQRRIAALAAGLIKQSMASGADHG
jgi:hypothetical protein